MKYFRKMFLTITLSAVICNTLSSESLNSKKRVKRILGGKDAELGQFTYQVSLQRTGINICGAAIISDQFILTAAHCITNEKGEFLKTKFTAVIGTVDLNDPNKDTMYINGSKYFIPKEYNSSGTPTIGDIAIIKLTRPIGLEVNSRLTKLNLPSEACDSYTGIKAVITGFGFNKVKVHTDPVSKKQFEVGESFGIMRYLHEKVIDNQECNNVMRKQIVSQHICARVIRHNLNPEGVCSGDSGSPLVIHGEEVIGVLVSGPIGCKEVRGAGIYTRVSSYKRFIRNAIREVNDPSIRIAEWTRLDDTGEANSVEELLEK